MADLLGLYQEAILDHYRRPRNFHKLEHSNRQADGYNPLCGDKLGIYLKIENGKIQDIGFAGSGCAISIASASMMTESLKGKTEAEAQTIYDNFILLMAHHSVAQSCPEDMGKLTVFSNVRDYPVRVKCATLAWHTLHAALECKQETVSTE
jgi:nitrogen fixation NifU-like protein